MFKKSGHFAHTVSLNRIHLLASILKIEKNDRAYQFSSSLGFILELAISHEQNMACSWVNNEKTKADMMPNVLSGHTLNF